MKVRKGYWVSLLLALGLLFWTEAWDAWQTPLEPATEKIATENDIQPWQSAEAVYECAMKAQELKLELVAMHVAADTLQGSLDVHGPRATLQEFYTWLETEGRFRAVLSFQLTTEDEKNSSLSVSYQL